MQAVGLVPWKSIVPISAVLPIRRGVEPVSLKTSGAAPEQKPGREAYPRDLAQVP